MTDLGTLGGSYVNSFAYDINDLGQVVGRASLPGNSLVHAFVWDAANGMTDLGTLGGSWTEAMGINNSEQVVGYSTLTGNDEAHPCVWENGIMYDLNEFHCNPIYWRFSRRAGISWVGMDQQSFTDPGTIRFGQLLYPKSELIYCP